MTTHFPSSLLKISSLAQIDLSSGNQFEGPIDFGNTSSSSKLEVLYLRHNNFRGQVPSSLTKLVNLYDLDLSYNKLEGQVPHCIWTSSSSKLEYVKLSHNSFNSFGKSLQVIDGGTLTQLDLASNSLQGPIPQWICKLRALEKLDLSNNHFTGSIPQCFKNFTSLEDLFLRNNSLSGFLPDIFTNYTLLKSFDVSRNNLVGKLPKSLISCENMEFLNVKGNKIKDTFPFWLGSLQNFKILLLRSNAFYGPIYNSSAYLGFGRIRIIDISDNYFVGSLPQDYFANWTTTEMSKVKYISYGALEGPYSAPQDSMDLVYKGVDMNFDLIFNGLKIIDFSGNRFSGDIPGSIGVLSDFRHLNLSGNAFTGNIPPSLANITNLESLDLSRNNLSGKIPQGLGKLSFLSNINFSYNHLEGLVPRSTQFQRQNCSSFVGNPGLYGLDDICGEIHHVSVPTSQQPEESLSEQEEPLLNWIAAAIAFGPGVFCGLVIGCIFTSYKHKWFIISR
ncbi:receptor like protein 30 [Arabidopsis lyrata subsp. lyrata]|uniref:receptor like protein 30 n=1 Tax=Arabidopsis lyrata subsp. lyrata TaxID=81972 RepID=UPI000A29AC67|nr:receptor like protein 30 [Arabidopsis lyrata subsp. lyrata]|eukprot:XP_002883392.2 receptor like protein 30 [Arabidopsis lyrata subsp. lyrata]